MTLYDIADYSPYKVFKAAQNLEGKFRAVTLDKDGLKAATEGSIPIGLVADESNKDEDTNVLLSGGGLWTLGEACDAGDLLSAGAQGLAKKSADGDFIFARALEAGDVNEAIRVQLIFAGTRD